MDVAIPPLFSNTHLALFDQISPKFTPLQKKIAAIGLVFFGFAALFIVCYKRCLTAQKALEEKKDGRPPAIAKKALPQIAPKPAPQQPKVVIIETDQPFEEADQTPETDQLQPLDQPQDPAIIPVPANQPQGQIEKLIDESKQNDDFLSILRCLIDHPEWVSVNIEQTIEVLHYFSSRFDLLQPIKITADLYENLLNEHPLLRAAENLKNIEIIFDNGQRYRTYLIIALKNLHLIRSLFEDQLKEAAQKKGKVEVHVHGHPKELKAILQYLDKSDLSPIGQIDYFQLVKLGSQYAMPSILRYCQGDRLFTLPNFLKENGYVLDKEVIRRWSQLLQQYTNLNTKHVDFIIDHLLSQIADFLHKEPRMIEFVEELTFDQLDAEEEEKLKEKLMERVKIIFSKSEKVREEHEDRITNSVDILERLASRLAGQQNASDYISCSSVNRALKILFKAGIAKQLKDEPILDSIQEALSVICTSKSITLDRTWKPIEWDVEEVRCIPSLAACLSNYLQGCIPDEIIAHPGWHGESLVLCFDENERKKIPLSERVIRFAENAVERNRSIGFKYLLRPSSRVISEPDKFIFTMTSQANPDEHTRGNVSHCRIEGIQDPQTLEWRYRDQGSQNAGLPLNDLIAAKANKLEPKPVEAPKTNTHRVAEYI